MRAWAPLLSCVAFATGAAAQTSVFSYERISVAEGIHVFAEPPQIGIVSGNSIVVIGSEAALVIDTGQHPALTRRMIAEIRTITPKPVRYVVNTHWHNDHVTGNAEYVAAFPGVTIIAHPFTAELMAKEIPRYTGERCRSILGGQMKSFREALAAGKTSDGREITPERRGRIERLLAEGDAAIAECDSYTYVAPNLTFEKAMTLQLGGREVRLWHPGRANTAGDVVAYVPDAKVLVTGDILVHPFPFATQSYIGEWAAVLRDLAKVDAVAIVPGHGRVLKDRSYLENVAGLMQAIHDQVRAAYKPGAKLEDVSKAVDLEAWRTRIAGDDPLLNAAMRGPMIQSAIARAFQEASGAMAPEGS